MNILRTNEPSLIRPEITRLIQDGILREVGKVKCLTTGKTVRTCEWTGEPYFSRGNKKAPFFFFFFVERQEQMTFSSN